MKAARFASAIALLCVSVVWAVATFLHVAMITA